MSDREELIFKKEREMWDALYRQDVAAFRKLVAEDAVMICGGYRCYGSEYAQYVRDFDITGYEITVQEVIYSVENAVQIHYVVNVKTDQHTLSDLGGVFHVVSLWKMRGREWKLVFNMDSRIITDNNQTD